MLHDDTIHLIGLLQFVHEQLAWSKLKWVAISLLVPRSVLALDVRRLEELAVPLRHLDAVVPGPDLDVYLVAVVVDVLVVSPRSTGER